MTEQRPGRGVGLAALLLGVLVAGFIVYGSLYPFRFAPLPEGRALGPAILAALLRHPGGRGDILANLVLYAPLGFALALALQARLRPGAAMGLAALACLLLSATMEVAQLHLPRRSSSGLDLLLNGVGGAAGALAAGWIRPRGLEGLPANRLVPADAFALFLLGCWLAYRLYPYIPALDYGEWRASLAPLLRPVPLDPWRVLRLAALWLVAARLLGAAWPRLGGTLPFAALLACVLAAAVPIVDRRLTREEVLAAGIALAAWPLLWRLRKADLLLLLCLLGATLAEGLAPYRFLSEPRSFGWVPFRSVMRGHWGSGLQAMLLKTCLYGGLLWLGLRVGLRGWLVVPAVVALALAISLARAWLPGRSADSTDVALALGAALLLFLGTRLSRGAPRCEAGGR
ncbi:VanZ family protein [Roseomonas sp. AR75]|uniref:VanZ family protein n=1 Tax=Roseomonas sp. AR75 TaxID=2562311 RepID=UPI0010BF95EA|nr:VanZ family protein [Roseomonas sp. AR75]